MRKVSRTARILDWMQDVELSGWLDVITGWIWTLLGAGILLVACLGIYAVLVIIDAAMTKGVYR